MRQAVAFSPHGCCKLSLCRRGFTNIRHSKRREISSRGEFPARLLVCVEMSITPFTPPPLFSVYLLLKNSFACPKQNKTAPYSGFRFIQNRLRSHRRGTARHGTTHYNASQHYTPRHHTPQRTTSQHSYNATPPKQTTRRTLPIFRGINRFSFQKTAPCKTSPARNKKQFVRNRRTNTIGLRGKPFSNTPHTFPPVVKQKNNQIIVLRTSKLSHF